MHQIQITMAEDFDVSTRGRFYEGVGAILDVVENHLFQVLTLLAMDPFSGRYDEAVREEKARFLRGVRTLGRSDVVRGQYRGYRDTAGVDPRSTVETYAAIRLRVDTWRWSDVPIIVRAGKCLPVKATEIIVELKRPLTLPRGTSTTRTCSTESSPRLGSSHSARLVEQVMTSEPYASARTVYWIVDNGSSHAGKTSIKRMQDRWPNARLIHLPVHASWLNQIELYFSILQRKALTPNDLGTLAERLLGFGKHYRQIARPFEWTFTRPALNKLLARIDRHEPQLALAA